MVSAMIAKASSTVSALSLGVTCVVSGVSAVANTVTSTLLLTLFMTTQLVMPEARRANSGSSFFYVMASAMIARGRSIVSAISRRVA